MNLSAQAATICELDPQLCAEQIHALQMLAYKQEAELLAIQNFPPLRRSVADIRGQQTQYWGIWQTTQTSPLIAAIGLETLLNPASEMACKLIASLVVAPSHQGQGFAKRLLQHMIHSHPHYHWQVSTAYQNHPARRLYQTCGFVECRQFYLPLEGAPPLHMLQMQRNRASDTAK